MDHFKIDQKLLESITANLESLGPHVIARPVPLLVGAGLAVLRGDLDAAIEGYRGAAAGFDAIDMGLVSSSARWRLGELLGGDEGRSLVGQVRAALSAEGIVRPDRVVAIFAPVPPDARRSDGK